MQVYQLFSLFQWKQNNSEYINESRFCIMIQWNRWHWSFASHFKHMKMHQESIRGYGLQVINHWNIPLSSEYLINSFSSGKGILSIIDCQSLSQIMAWHRALVPYHKHHIWHEFQYYNGRKEVNISFSLKTHIVSNRLWNIDHKAWRPTYWFLFQWYQPVMWERAHFSSQRSSVAVHIMAYM